METTIANTATTARPSKSPEPLLPLTWRFTTVVTFAVPAFLVIVRHPITLETWRSVALSYVVDVMVTMAILGLLLFAYSIPLPRLFVHIQSRAARGVVHCATIISGVLVGIAVAKPLIRMVCPPDALTHSLQNKVVALVATAVVVAAALSYERLQQRTREVERRAENAQRAALLARLEALQARTNPHFLFNSLNTVASLIPTDPACAEATLERLAGLFRYSLDGARRTSVPLADELTATCDYLDVEALRLGDRIRWKLVVDDDLGDVRVPPLTLQPLVENAVLHAVAPRKDGGRILIEVHGSDDGITLAVEDDGPGTNKPQRTEGTGTALSNLERRLAVLYGEAASVKRQRTDIGGFRIEVVIPCGTTT